MENNNCCIALTNKKKQCKKQRMSSTNYCKIHYEIDKKKKEACSICYENIPTKKIKRLELENCKHTFCRLCISPWIIKNPTCPMCRKGVTDVEQWICVNQCVSLGKVIITKVVTYHFYELNMDDQMYMLRIIHELFQRLNRMMVLNDQQLNQFLEYLEQDARAKELYGYVYRQTSVAYMVKQEIFSPIYHQFKFI